MNLPSSRADSIMVTAGQQNMRVRPSATGMKVMQVREVIRAVAPEIPTTMRSV